MLNKKQERFRTIEEKIRTEISQDQEYNYQEIVKSISRAKNQLGYLTLQQIAQAVKQGIGNDLPTFLKELEKRVETKKIKHYTIYFKSHFNAPDFEDETDAETREEAMKIFLNRNKELNEIDKEDLIKNIWCADDIPF